ncbi:MAG: hypothetical protein ACT6RD_12880 [Brevundimonas sp.]|uniref:hypothetical protein n=1 Tax=Brevundimonas sp. TaxID=1871086 RepID=UPI0040331FDD
MNLTGVIAAFAAAPVVVAAHGQTVQSTLVVEAVRYCVGQVDGPTGEAPVGFVAQPATGAISWVAGSAATKVMIFAGDDPLYKAPGCMILTPGLGADADLPDWFQKQGFTADHGGLGFGFFRRHEGAITIATWLRPEDTTDEGGVPMLLVAIRKVKDPN